ncbi:cytochrome P450 [Nocardia lijiangensis]|uniref:cytochrome P450 n=1 Tax=Nocardia lijiangensis TaxID=299618 RepID=UPI00138FA66C|nr:cytochrome P450 [Nocardia lijiangensis]
MRQIFDAGFAADPWPVLSALRREGGVHRVRTPDGPPAWLVTRHADVRAALSDERLTTDVTKAGPVDYAGFAVPPPLDALLVAGADDHARLRRLITAELGPRRTAEWDERAGDLIDSLLRDTDTDPKVDLVARLAIPLPAAVLGDLLGLADAEREALLGWANSTLLPGATAPRARDTLATMRTLVDAVTARAHAGTAVGRLVAARDETGSPTADELAGVLFYLLFVWYEVLADLIAGALLTLVADPTHRRVFRAATDRRRAVDELLRYLSPQVLTGPRFATTDLDIGDYTVRAGQTVLLCLAGANRDPVVFDRPDRFDPTRARNAQLGLGHGPHSCLGTALVHGVAGSVLEHFFDRWPETTLTTPAREIPWRSGFRHRGPLILPVALA